MLIADMPNAPPSTPSVMLVAQANTASPKTISERQNIAGICDVLNLNRFPQADLSPVITVNSYYFRATGVKINPDTAKITVLQQPKHGRVEPTNSDGDWNATRYLPNDGYLGNDFVVLQVEGNGNKVELRYFLTVTDEIGDTKNTNPICNLRTFWKISQDTNGNRKFRVRPYI